MPLKAARPHQNRVPRSIGSTFETLEPRRLLSGSPLGNVISGTVDSQSVSIARADGLNINPDQTTWLIVHGWQSSPSSSEIAALTSAVLATQPGTQVLTLDWSSLADTGDLDPYDALDATPDVGKWVETTLASYGFNLANLNLIGHSYGCYVCAEVGINAPAGVHVIDAIDPGYDVNSPGDGFDPETAVDLANDAKYSWAFFSPTGLAIGGPSLDDADVARTADQSFVFSGTTHVEGPAFYANLLLDNDIVGQVVSLDSLLAEASGAPAPWKPDEFGHDGQQSSTGSFDAVLTSRDDYVTPKKLEFFPAGESSPVTDTNASPGVTPAGDLIVPGTSGDDAIGVQLVDGQTTANVNGVSSTFGDDPISEVKIYAGAGNDAVSIGPGVAATDIYGGAGNDTIACSNAIGDTLVGGAGADSLTGGSGDDLLQGGQGADTLAGGPGADTLYAGAGANKLQGGSGNDVFFAANGAVDTLTGGAGENTAYVDGSDVYNASQFATILEG
jgi:Ca2+-binding RTX toxin-like protein